VVEADAQPNEEGGRVLEKEQIEAADKLYSWNGLIFVMKWCRSSQMHEQFSNRRNQL
jgi:hypothetical protein